MPAESLIAAVLILSAAAFVQSVSGFGMALVAMAGLPLVMPLREAISLVAVFNLFASLVTLWHNRAGFSWQSVLPLAISIGVGVPIGFYFLHSADPEIVKRSLGAVLVLIAVSDLRLSPHHHYRLPSWAAVPLGFTGGLVGGAFNVGGPPIVAFVYSQNWSKVRSVAVLQAVFFLSGLVRNALMGPAGDYTRNLFVVLAWTIVPSMVTIALGKKLLDRIPKAVLRKGVFGFVLVMGLKYLIWG